MKILSKILTGSGHRNHPLRLPALCIGLALLAGTAWSFFPTTLLTAAGLLGTSHMKMTETAIKDLDAEFFGITDLTKPMKKAIKEIAEANAEVDEDQFTSAKHFDGENFAGGQALLTGVLLPNILASLANDDATSARQSLGQALHSIQDFYSHSNWIELGNSGPNAQLGRPGMSIGPVAGSLEATCTDCIDPILPVGCPDCTSNLTTGKLTSGYYSGEDKVKPGSFKCSHGGYFDGSATGLFGHGINKDNGVLCDFSPHFSDHAAAVAAATEATKQFIRDIKMSVTEREIKLLLGVGPTLAFSIDTTGSMGSIISQVKSEAISIVNARLGTDEEPSKYVLVPFSDPGVGPALVTTDPDEFKAAISGLGASGGGDCPELAMNGALQGISASDEGGSLFTFTDASAKDSGLSSSVSSLAISKQVKVYPVLFGSCSPIDPGYIKIAADTGGQLFFLSVSEASKITTLADLTVRSNAVDILTVSGELGGAPKTYTCPLDFSLSKATISISGTTTATVARPDGSLLAAGDPGVTVVPLSTGVIYSVAYPVPGEWTVVLNGTGAFSLAVTGEATLALDAFDFVELGGRPGHEGYFPIDGLPQVGGASMVVAALSGDYADVSFEFRSADNSTLQSFALTHGPGQSDDEYSGLVVPPVTSFVVYARGHDLLGNEFLRLLPGATSAQPLKLSAPPPQVLKPGSAVTYVFKAIHVGTPTQFDFVAKDDKNFVASVTPSSATLGDGEELEIHVTLSVPLGATEGDSDTLTLTATSATNPDNKNFAVLVSTIGIGGLPPDCSGAVPSLGVLWPPNHAFIPVAIEGVVDPDGEAVTITIQSILQDEAVKSKGAGSTSPDGMGVGEGIAQLRSERSGTGNGRVYTVHFLATDPSGSSCEGSVKVCVPHGVNGGCFDDGTTFDSTQP